MKMNNSHVRRAETEDEVQSKKHKGHPTGYNGLSKMI